MLWVTTEKESVRQLPKWLRTAGIDDEGRVFLPARIAGNEDRVLLCAIHDGVGVISEFRHPYVPADWLIEEYPDVADDCRFIVGKVREHVTTTGEVGS